MMNPARIMIVEDDRIVARDIREQLTRTGHSVTSVTSRGETAVDLAISTEPDLVLMDIRLEGEVDGIEAAKQIRARCGVPVVFLTAYADDETVRRASQAEPFGYLLKPFEDLQLRTVIEMALYKHRADRKLRESERRYEATLSSIGDGVIATDEKGQVTFINPVAEAMTGWTKDAAVGLPLASVYHVTDVDRRPVRETPIARALASSLVCKTADQAILISRGGQEFPIDEKCAPIIGDSGSVSGAVLVFSDTSDRRRAASTLQAAQANLARMSRVTTMGQMTASIAHEVNQPLMAVVMNAEACLKWMDGAHRDVGEARAAAGRAISEAHRAAKIIERIRAIARNTPVTFETIDLNEIIEGILAIVQPEFRHQEIAVDIELQPGPLPVVGDRIQLQQVMLNLLSNAADALNGCETPNRRAIVRSWAGTSGDIWTAVEDTGAGIASDCADQIFEPFFTTKQAGIGMGLSICRSIVEAHGGELRVEARAPQGTRCLFSLPSGKSQGTA
jgi:PAS domain S-box-containing protein